MNAAHASRFGQPTDQIANPPNARTPPPPARRKRTALRKKPPCAKKTDPPRRQRPDGSSLMAATERAATFAALQQPAPTFTYFHGSPPFDGPTSPIPTWCVRIGPCPPADRRRRTARVTPRMKIPTARRMPARLIWTHAPAAVTSNTKSLAAPSRPGQGYSGPVTSAAPGTQRHSFPMVHGPDSALTGPEHHRPPDRTQSQIGLAATKTEAGGQPPTSAGYDAAHHATLE